MRFTLVWVIPSWHQSFCKVHLRQVGANFAVLCRPLLADIFWWGVKPNHLKLILHMVLQVDARKMWTLKLYCERPPCFTFLFSSQRERLYTCVHSHPSGLIIKAVTFYKRWAKALLWNGVSTFFMSGVRFGGVIILPPFGKKIWPCHVHKMRDKCPIIKRQSSDVQIFESDRSFVPKMFFVQFMLCVEYWLFCTGRAFGHVKSNESCLDVFRLSNEETTLSWTY